MVSATPLWFPFQLEPDPIRQERFNIGVGIIQNDRLTTRFVEALWPLYSFYAGRPDVDFDALDDIVRAATSYYPDQAYSEVRAATPLHPQLHLGEPQPLGAPTQGPCQLDALFRAQVGLAQTVPHPEPLFQIGPNGDSRLNPDRQGYLVALWERIQRHAGSPLRTWLSAFRVAGRVYWCADITGSKQDITVQMAITGRTNWPSEDDALDGILEWEAVDDLDAWQTLLFLTQAPDTDRFTAHYCGERSAKWFCVSPVIERPSS
ncbi:hypothetical protein MA04_03910 [Alcanivorax balearicus MACL04]|uniref:Uncharacterized protein n=2 Tax=Alloalcanivorax TaxID=3020832 RepID=A0A9Q3W8J9_9GAMM|nr:MULTISPECIES: hypothetical protein [Alloalcanivorax]MCE7511015.1 hypothetical protein [Alloalcanivorax xenomutans]MCU5784610.1 hypothetical protein [Alloalcanivorax balearicus MACL04]